MHRLLIFLALLVGGVLWVYQEAPLNSFHFDDDINILRVPAIHIKQLNLESLSQVLSDAHLTTRPLPNITFAIDWWRGSGIPRPFQWTNIIIHCLVAILVFMLLYTLLGRRGLRTYPLPILSVVFLATLVWAIHPIQTQAVTYIVQRMASMAALFILLSVVSYIIARRTQGRQEHWLWLTIALLSALLAVLCKENAYVLPFLILLAEYGVVRNDRPLVAHPVDKVMLAMPVVIALYVVFDIGTGMGPLSKHFLPGYQNRDFTLSERLLTQPRIIFHYLSQMVWPLPQRFSIEHDFTVSSSLLRPWTTLLALLGIVVWVVVGIWLLFQQGRRMYGFFILWVPATLAIESSFVALEMVFEHRMYLPSVGLAGLLALGLEHLYHRGVAQRYAMMAVMIVIAVALAWSSMNRIPVWRTKLALYQDAVRHAPQSSRAWGNLGLYFYDTGDLPQAEQALQTALKLNPKNAKSMETYGVLLTKQGRYDEALTALRRVAMMSKEISPSLMNHLGTLYLEKKDYASARYYFQEAIKYEGWDPVYYWNLALAYERDGDCRNALAVWRQYLQVEPLVVEREKTQQHLREKYSPGGKCYMPENRSQPD